MKEIGLMIKLMELDIKFIQTNQFIQDNIIQDLNKVMVKLQTNIKLNLKDIGSKTNIKDLEKFILLTDQFLKVNLKTVKQSMEL